MHIDDEGIAIANDHHRVTADDFDFVAERDLTWKWIWNAVVGLFGRIRGILMLFALVSCGLQPLSEQDIAITDDQCPHEMFLIGQCDQPPLVPESVTE